MGGRSPQPSSRARRRRATRQGRVTPAALVPLLLLVLILVAGWLGTPPERRPSLARWTDDAVEAEPWVDPARLAAGVVDLGCDPRWGLELAQVLADAEPFRVDDDVALAALHDALERISFVGDVEHLSADEEAGLQLDLTFREPVACVPVSAGFLTVDAQGVLLSGAWSVPPRVDGASLPVVGPMEDGDGLFALARPGDWLAEDAHLDALDVALSLETHLDADARRALGRVVIDATRARAASVEEPGVRLLLEERRLVLFGRRPSSGEPGELAAAAKWRSLQRALETLDAPADPVDWDVVDVRWDHPELVRRSPALAALQDPSGSEAR
jgi:hypothetical protein